MTKQQPGSAGCVCPHDGVHCPHCGRVIDAVMGREQSHLDRCHRAAVGATVTDTAVLTAQTIYNAIEKVRADAEYTVCVGSNQHVVHPAEYERGGLARCGRCFQVVYIPTPEERDV